MQFTRVSKTQSTSIHAFRHKHQACGRLLRDGSRSLSVDFLYALGQHVCPHRTDSSSMFVTQYRTKCCDERTGPTCLPASYRFISQSPFLPDQSPFETIGRSLSSACTIQSVRLLSWTRTSLSVPILGEAWQFHSRIRQPRGVLAQSD